MSQSLQQKNTRYLLIWLPLVMLLGSLFFFLLLNGHARHMQTEQLELKQRDIRNALLTQSGALAFHIRGEYDIIKGQVDSKGILDHPRDTSVYYADTKEWKTFSILTKQLAVKDAFYQLTTYVSAKEVTHLIIKVSIAEVVIFILLLNAIVIINRKSSRLLWKPFYDTMKEVEEYDIIQNKTLPLTVETGIKEFNRLNQTILTLIDNVNLAYSNQKQFVENASHELQTPLAIIRSKVELLIDTAHLTEETANLLTDITDANERLSQMNKNLLLLAKIDNHQFPELHRIHLSDIIRKLITYYQEYYDAPLPVIRISLEPDIYLLANASLIEILINNLIRNSIVHNIPGGYIDVRVTHTDLTIENTGYPIAGNTEQFFERFKKGREESKTTGLGLSIVKQICALYKFDLQYIYSEGIHRMRIHFGKV